MKNFVLLILFVVGLKTVVAQPSDAQQKADIKKEFPKALSIELKGNGATVKEYDNGKERLIYRKAVTVIMPTSNPKYPNVKLALHGGVNYNITSGSNSYQGFSPSYEELIGMPDPDKEEVLAFIEDNLSEIFRLGHRNEMIGMPGKFSIDENTKYTWPTFNRVNFNATVVYERFKNNIGDAETLEHTMLIRLYREDEGPWNNINAGDAEGLENPRKILSTRNYSAQERENLKSFEMLLLTAEAEKKWATMKPINLEGINDLYDVKDYVHGFFMTADKRRIENLLYQMLASYNFVKPDFRVLTSDGKALIDKTLEKTVSGDFLYKNQYCENPEVKEVGNGYIDYWNKNKTAYTRLEVGKEEGVWKLGGITIYVISTLDKAKEIEATACGSGALSAVQRGQKNAGQKMTKNDWVLAYYDSDGYWYPAFYLGYASNYHDIQYFEGNAKSKVRNVVPFSPEVGDKGFVKLQNGQLAEVTIKSINKFDIVIDFNGQEINHKLSGIQFK